MIWSYENSGHLFDMYTQIFDHTLLCCNQLFQLMFAKAQIVCLTLSVCVLFNKRLAWLEWRHFASTNTTDTTDIRGCKGGPSEGDTWLVYFSFNMFSLSLRWCALSFIHCLCVFIDFPFTLGHSLLLLSYRINSSGHPSLNLPFAVIWWPIGIHHYILYVLAFITFITK